MHSGDQAVLNQPALSKQSCNFILSLFFLSLLNFPYNSTAVGNKEREKKKGMSKMVCHNGLQFRHLFLPPFSPSHHFRGNLPHPECDSLLSATQSVSLPPPPFQPHTHPHPLPIQFIILATATATACMLDDEVISLDQTFRRDIDRSSHAH